MRTSGAAKEARRVYVRREKGSFEHLAWYRMKRTCAGCEGEEIKIAELVHIGEGEEWEGREESARG